MIIGDIETTEKVEYEDLLKNYYEKMEIIEEQDKEIERLNNTIFNQNKRNSHQRIANDNLQNKNKELNNIINEFMEELKWQRKVSLSLNEAFAVSRIDTLINKLQELKGSDKDE